MIRAGRPVRVQYRSDYRCVKAWRAIFMRDRVPAYRLAGETFVERIERGQRSLEFVNQLFVVRAVWGYANDDEMRRKRSAKSSQKLFERADGGYLRNLPGFKIPSGSSVSFSF